nr:NADH dehydrogenase subunit 4 [Bhawania goodei]
MLTTLLMSFSLLSFPLLSLGWYYSMFGLFIISLMFIPSIYDSMNSTHAIFLNFHLDSLSSTLILLTLWVSALMLSASQNVFSKKMSPNKFMSLIILLNLLLLLTFMSSNLMMFYIMFEGSLIPTLLLILGWGYQPERLQASMYLMMYTITASLPLLLSILYMLMLNNHCLMNFPLWETPFLSMMPMSIWWLASIMAFMVKMPLYLTHLWLPKAHVEAPVAGSMILAGVLLKLGGYGALRMIQLYQPSNLIISLPLISLSLLGAVITSTICMRQTDIKSLIAYSSVGHMGILIAGLMSCSIWGYQGALLMMIAHGLCSSGMFAIANMMYEFTKTRSMYMTKGMLTLFPTMTLIWFMFTCANMAAPPSINLLSEIILITSIISTSFSFSPLIALISFLAAVYSLILYTNSQHGSPSSFTNPGSYLIPRNIFVSLMHLLPVFFFILTPNVLML